MAKSLFLLSISLLVGTCLMACTQPPNTPESAHNRLCVEVESKGLKEIAKHFGTRPTKLGTDGVPVECACLTNGIKSILTPEQFELMESKMAKASLEDAFEVRNNYLESLLPRGTQYSDQPYTTVKSTCKQYMKVWRNSYSMRDEYTPPPPY